ncbi:hypothetical protein EFK50_04695 [Nocardioides marmoriginsengisoli]|uniref:Ig-like domain-containing protein n=1 Tax=Nocardioides marmoriginsengisoli TaxID=661483 RepID=A0A3N0CP71_9ACTN|nr:hypothetical protein [Nocardioides marmoriginsengisoli]RNL65262.1 hypothetical protein EFK50_04695 [Nocardioides marmoriginsengisoli]
MSGLRIRRRAGRLLPLALVVAGLVVSSPAVAPAGATTNVGSLVFIKNHNVWVSRPDGTGQRALTSTGTAAAPWRSPDQSDRGTVVAVRGTKVYRMNQWGTELTVLDPPDLKSSAGELIGGAVKSTTISPDGTKITYTYERYSCPLGPPPSPACRLRWVTAITAADRLTSPTQWGISFYDHPTWLTNSRLLLNGIGFDQIYLFDLGRGSMFWFHEGMVPGSDFKTLADGAVSRSGGLMAMVRGEFQDSRIRIYTLPGSPREGGVPPLPTAVCESNPLTGYRSPTFAPDSSALAWSQPDGLWVKDAPADCGVPAELVIGGGSQPSWSLSPLQTTRPAPIAFQVVRSPVVSGTPKARRTLRVSAGAWSVPPTSVSYQWCRNGRPIARATKAAYRVQAKDRKRSLSVRVTVRKAGYATRTVTTRPVRVRR